MFKFDNTHIFTGYLKQLLSSVNLPTCRVYTKEFAEYYKKHGKEDPRVIESFNNIEYLYGATSKARLATRVSYLKGNELSNYFWEYNQDRPLLNRDNTSWRPSSSVFYDSHKKIAGLTKVLNSPGCLYDAATHEYLGDFLRFVRDYYNINLMSLYNCFNNKICNNIYYKHSIKPANTSPDAAANQIYKESYRIFDSRDSKYCIYAFPVKLFSDYTIAIDCSSDIELFCGIYKTKLDTSSKAIDLISRTYTKVNRTYFRQPFLYDKLNVKHWNFERDCGLPDNETYPRLFNDKVITRWDIANREQDLKLFIKIPTACKSSIVVLEGDFRNFNDFKYAPPGKYLPNGKPLNQDDVNTNENIACTRNAWEFKQNHAAINFGSEADIEHGLDINECCFKPVGKLQLLAFNTEESYPFADRLVEYLSGSAITPIDKITDNIKRAQKVMSSNNHYFKIEGLWEDKMQKIVYDYLINAGPIEAVTKDGKTSLNDRRRGYHPRLGYTTKSTLYDVLGYIDKEAEKWYASWTVAADNKAVVRDSIQNVDIYNGLFDV